MDNDWYVLSGVEFKSLCGRNALVDIYIKKEVSHTKMVLAERKDNQGPSISEDFGHYIEQACESHKLVDEHCMFFELHVEPHDIAGSTTRNLRLHGRCPRKVNNVSVYDRYEPATNTKQSIICSLQSNFVLIDSY